MSFLLTDYILALYLQKNDQYAQNMFSLKHYKLLSVKQDCCFQFKHEFNVKLPSE